MFMRVTGFFLLFLTSQLFGQASLDQVDLDVLFETYRESTIDQRRFKHKDITPVIDRISQNDQFEVRTLGESMEGRPIRMISIGEGETDVLLWSQMHGNEPTATMAIMLPATSKQKMNTNTASAKSLVKWVVILLAKKRCQYST